MPDTTRSLKCPSCGWLTVNRDLIVCPQCGQNTPLQISSGQPVTVHPPSKGIVVGAEKGNPSQKEV